MLRKRKILNFQKIEKVKMGSNQKESWKENYKTYRILNYHIIKLRKRIEVLQLQLANYESQREEVKYANLKYSREQSKKRRDKIKKLKDAGCYSVTFAIESGNTYIREKMLNRYMNNEKIIDRCKMLREHGIKYRIFCMCGIPNETIDNMIETLDLCIKCKPLMGRISIYQPYPNHLLANEAIKLGLWDGKINDIKETYFEDSMLNFEASFKQNLRNFHRVFGFIVRYPWTRFLLKFLMKMPVNNFFERLYFEERKQGYRDLFNVSNLYW